MKMAARLSTIGLGLALFIAACSSPGTLGTGTAGNDGAGTAGTGGTTGGGTNECAAGQMLCGTSCIDTAAEGSGYMLSSGCEIPFHSTEDRIEHFFQYSREYGRQFMSRLKERSPERFVD